MKEGGGSFVQISLTFQTAAAFNSKEIDMTDNNDNFEDMTQAKEIQVLYVQTAAGMRYEDGLLTLEGVPP